MHCRDLYLKKKKGMTADKLKVFNAQSAVKFKVQWAKNITEDKVENVKKKKVWLTHHWASYTKQKRITAADDDSTDDDEKQWLKKRVKNSVTEKENLLLTDEQKIS